MQEKLDHEKMINEVKKKDTRIQELMDLLKKLKD